MGKSIKQQLKVSLLTFMRGMEKGVCSFMSSPPEDPFYFLAYWSARWVGEGDGMEEERAFQGEGRDGQLCTGENIRIFPQMWYDLGTKKEIQLS